MIHSHMKTWSTSLVAGEMKLQLRDIILYLTDWQRSKSLITCCVGKGVGKQAFSFIASGRGKLSTASLKRNWQYLSKLKIYIPFSPASLFHKICHTNTLVHMQVDVWMWLFICSFAYNNNRLETAYLAISRATVKWIVENLFGVIL